MAHHEHSLAYLKYQSVNVGLLDTLHQGYPLVYLATNHCIESVDQSSSQLYKCNDTLGLESTNKSLAKLSTSSTDCGE